MNDTKILDEILENLGELSNCIHRNHHKRAEEVGLTIEQYHLLLKLGRIIKNKKLLSPTIGELAHMFNNAQNTMSEKISRLEKKKLIERVRDEEDRRIIRIVLSENGKETLDNIHNKAKDEALHTALLSMDKNVVKNFSAGLKEITIKLKKQ